ncbi:MAG: RodZ domain-containing protein [Candidatus Baltobacteraceae bacterium]|jgi:transcriptional regulator with XRE-family HTH domain
MAGLGDEFRAAREARHLSLSDVSEQLHIRSLYLQSIEREEWGSIGAAVYVRGFIRAYARFLGIDPERAIAEFNASRPAVDPATRYAVSPAPSPAGLRAPAAASRPSPWLMIAALVALGLVAFVGYNYFEVQTNNRPAPNAVATATSAPALAENGSDDQASPTPAGSLAPSLAVTPAAVPSPTPAPTPTLAPSRTIEVRLTDRSWLRVDVDGAKALEGIFPAGTRKEFHGRSAYVRAGNAGGVVVVVNGKDEGTMGHSGDVVERTFALAQE